MVENKRSRHATYSLSYSDRANHPSTPQLTSYLLRLMTHKQSNLCLSADVQSTAELLDLAEECGDSIVLLKTHADIVQDFSHHTIKGLVEISKRKQFLLFEDRKFGDIGNTVQSQYAAGSHRIATWAQLANAHIFPGPAIIEALKSAAYSALAAGNSSIETEITGGGPPSKELGAYMEEQRQKRRSQIALHDGSNGSKAAESSSSDDTEDEQEAEQEAKHTMGAKQRRSLRLDDGLRRKNSVVSVSTIISSSAEYISPPTTAHAASFPLSTSGSQTPLPPPPMRDLPTNPPYARGLLLLAQMSSKDNLLGPEYTRTCVQQAQQHRDFVLGFIAQESLNVAPDDNFLTLTPGISLPPVAAAGAPADENERAVALHKGDALGQQYNTPRHAILNKGVDVIIVGRGVLNARDSGAEAERYRKEGWAAYTERMRTQ